jgi:acetylglutamate kinase
MTGLIEEKIIKARTLVEALPYIRKFQGKTLIVKYGGSIMVDDHLRALFAQDVILLKYVGLNPIIVHGGGKEISKWMNRLGKEAIFIDGLRYTDEETMEVAEMVLSGKINNDLVSLINQHGGKAVGLSGKDADLVIARKVKSMDAQDLGFVGDIESVDYTLLTTLCDRGYIPVIASVARNQAGDTLNMNADHIAEGIASAMKAEKLIFLTDVQGIMKEGKFLGHITLDEAQQLIKHPDIKGGMIPKLHCAIDALEGGVNRVHIINGTIEHAVLLEVFTDTGIGTMLSSSN